MGPLVQPLPALLEVRARFSSQAQALVGPHLLWSTSLDPSSNNECVCSFYNHLEQVMYLNFLTLIHILILNCVMLSYVVFKFEYEVMHLEVYQIMIMRGRNVKF